MIVLKLQLHFRSAEYGAADAVWDELPRVVPRARARRAVAAGRGGDAPAAVAGGRRQADASLPAAAAPRARRPGGQRPRLARTHATRYEYWTQPAPNSLRAKCLLTFTSKAVARRGVP